MKHAHAMPFGATIDGDAVRFRLWAPGARDVAVMLGTDSDDARPLAPLPDDAVNALQNALRQFEKVAV